MLMSFSAAKLEEALNTLRNGGVLLYPSDTIYGLGCDALNQEALERIYEMKQRPPEKSFLVLVGSRSVVEKYFSISTEAELLEKIWPGPFTVLLRPNEEYLAELSHLCGPTGKIGVRWAQSEFLSSLFAKWSGLLTSTSANLSGQEYSHDNATQESLWKAQADTIVFLWGDFNESALKERLAQADYPVVEQGQIFKPISFSHKSLL
jgi:L-threonylcarbamoyladenylate synthase